MTGVEETVWTRLSRAALVAGLAFATAAPYLYYLSTVAFPERVSDRFGLSPAEVLAVDLPLTAAAAALAALIGALFSERHGLPGLGTWADLRAALRRFGPVAAIASALGYAVVGRALAARVPGTSPDTLGWALVVWAKAAVFDEVIARYGMLTVVWSVTRRRWLANGLQAAFFTATVVQGLGFLGVAPSADPTFAGALALTFAGHLAMGAAQLRYGLRTTVALRALFEVRYLLHAVLV